MRSTTSIPAGQDPAAAAPNPLGRIALVIGSIGLLITCLWAIAQMTVLNLMMARQATDEDGMMAQGGETLMALHGTVTMVIYAVTFGLALVSTILAAKAFRRKGLSKVAAAIAIGMSGSSLATYVALLIGNVLMAFLPHLAG
ncbi:MAG: hypothetical protein QM650_14365 [Microlunatus sp.]